MHTAAGRILLGNVEGRGFKRVVAAKSDDGDVGIFYGIGVVVAGRKVSFVFEDHAATAAAGILVVVGLHVDAGSWCVADHMGGRNHYLMAASIFGNKAATFIHASTFGRGYPH